jgi:hypothetical protein
MATPQAQLAAQMADQFGLPIVQFRYSDELLFGDGEVMKLFMPRSKQVLLGTPQDRMIIGDLKFVLKRDLTKLRSPSNKFEQPASSFGCPLANFPWLVSFCWISEGRIDERIVVGLRELFDALPDTENAWRSRFGPDFFEMAPIDRLVPIVRYLRKLDPELDPD